MHKRNTFKLKYSYNFKYQQYLLKLRPQDLDPLFNKYQDYMVQKGLITSEVHSNIILAIQKA